METTTTTRPGWRKARRILISSAVFATLIALFYTEEDWRGKHAWENCKHSAEAKGVVLDWNALIPPPVPDDQNFFGVPQMQRWFIKDADGTTNELNGLLTNADKIAIITTETAAKRFLAWSDQYQPDFDLMREALQRPDSRMNGDYSISYLIPVANFVNVRALAQTLSQRTKCYLLLGQPDKALEQLTLLNHSRQIMERLPTGQPMTLLDAMINVAVTGLYADTIAYGLQHHAWQEPQLAALQSQLAAINLPPYVSNAFYAEEAGHCHIAETLSFGEIMDLFQSTAPAPSRSFLQKLEHPRLDLYSLAPRGWAYQNMIVLVEFGQDYQDGFDLQNNTISPQKTDSAMRKMETALRHFSPYKLWARMAMPNISRASQRLAFNQNEVNEAEVACALERYHLQYGVYPASLDSLVPHFIEALPHDIIGGRPMIYRPTSDGKFLLYSIGWNEKDDGGQITKAMKNGQIDFTQGDWVWDN